MSGGIGGWSWPSWGLPPMSTGRTRCSGSHTESKPSRSASSVTATHADGLSTPRERANFTVRPPASAGVGTVGRAMVGSATGGLLGPTGDRVTGVEPRPTRGHGTEPRRRGGSGTAAAGDGLTAGSSPKRADHPLLDERRHQRPGLGEDLAPDVGHAPSHLGALVVVEEPAVPGHGIVEATVMVITAVDSRLVGVGRAHTRVRPHGGRDGQVAGEVGQQRPGQVGPPGDGPVPQPGVEDRGARPRRGRWGPTSPPGAAPAPTSACRRARPRPDLPPPGVGGVPDDIAGGRVQEDVDGGAPPVPLAHGHVGAGHRPAPVGDVDVEAERPPVVHGPGEHGVGRAHPVVRELLRGRHDGLGQQLAPVDDPPDRPRHSSPGTGGRRRAGRRTPPACPVTLDGGARTAPGPAVNVPRRPGPPPPRAGRRRPGRRRSSRPGGRPGDGGPRSSTSGRSRRAVSQRR